MEGTPISRLRPRDLTADQREELFQQVIADYLSGPKLEDIAKARQMSLRTLQRFMTAHNHQEWLDAQEMKQYGRVEDARDRGVVWDEKLYNSAGYRLDRIEALRQKLKR